MNERDSVFECAHCGDGDALRDNESCAYCGRELPDGGLNLSASVKARLWKKP